MKIIQISDLHIDKDTISPTGEYREMLKNFYSELQKIDVKDEVVYVLICGDLLKKGGFSKKVETDVNDLLDKIKEKIAKARAKEIHFLIVPGNHDLWGQKKSLKKYKQLLAIIVAI